MEVDDTESDQTPNKQRHQCETCLAIGFQIADKEKVINELNEELDAVKKDCYELREK